MTVNPMTRTKPIGQDKFCPFFEMCTCGPRCALYHFGKCDISDIADILGLILKRMNEFPFGPSPEDSKKPIKKFEFTQEV